jgi:hypothetical protein
VNPREFITRSIAGLLAALMVLGAALIASYVWIGEEDWRGLVEVLMGFGIAWVLAGYALAFPGPRTIVRSQWKRLRQSTRELIVRLVAVVLTVAMFVDIVLVAYSFWAGAEKGLFFEELSFGIVVAWVIAGNAFGVPQSRTYSIVIGATAAAVALVVGYFDGPWDALPMLILAAYMAMRARQRIPSPEQS